jgi:hypothetical protein
MGRLIVIIVLHISAFVHSNSDTYRGSQVIRQLRISSGETTNSSCHNIPAFQDPWNVTAGSSIHDQKDAESPLDCDVVVMC